MAVHAGWLCAYCGAVAVACYLNAPACDFVFDDRLAILSNPDVQPRAPLAPLLHNDFWGKALVKEDSNKSYRPLTILSFRLHTWWTGAAPDPAAFHAVNVLLHAVVTMATTELAARLWRGCGLGGHRRVALLSGLVFAAHPVHVEAVTGVVGRAELLCALWCLAGAAAHALSRRRRASRCASAGWSACVAACVAGATLSKETGVALVGILAADELLVALPARGRRWLPGGAARLCVLALCAGVYALTRLRLMTPEGEALSYSAASLAKSGLIRRAENPLAFVASRRGAPARYRRCRHGHA